MLAFDRSLRTFDADGRLRVETCNISKANVCPYLGSEIPNSAALGLDPNSIYQLYRDPSELFAAADTFRNLPLLIDHVPVSAEAPQRDLWCGSIGSDVRFEAPYLKASISVWTAEAIQRIEQGIQEELSSAYRYMADMTPGVSPDGVQFDGVMRNLQGNHVALVKRGRAGPDVVVADELPQTVIQKMKFPNFVKVLGLLLGLKPEQQIALDAAMKEDDSEDCGYDGELDDDEKKAAKDAAMKEFGKDSLTDVEEKEAYKKAALDKRARDSAPEKPEGGAPKPAQDAITQDQLNAAVATAVDAARLAERAAATELLAAREAVKAHVGAVALDTATGVYEFALKQMGVDLAGIPASAYPAVMDFATKCKAAKPAPVVAQDSDTLNKALSFLNPRH